MWRCRRKGGHLLAGLTLPGLDEACGVCCDHNFTLFIAYNPRQRTLHRTAPQEFTLREKTTSDKLFAEGLYSSGYSAFNTGGGNSGRKSVSVAAGMKPAHTRGLKLQLIAVRISGLVYVKGLNAVRYSDSNAATFTSGFTLWHLKSKIKHTT